MGILEERRNEDERAEISLGVHMSVSEADLAGWAEFNRALNSVQILHRMNMSVTDNMLNIGDTFNLKASPISVTDNMLNVDGIF